MATLSKRIEGRLRSLPVAECGADVMGERGEWFKKWVCNRDLTNGYWSRFRLADSLDRVGVPVLIQTGWQDLFFGQAIEQYHRLHERGVDVAMTVGPWGHLDIEGKAAPMLIAENFDWLSAHLSGAPLQRSAPVKVFVTGADQWQDRAVWPPPTATRTFHLQPADKLGDQPCTAPSSASFTYDPTEPTPSIGGRLMFAQGGYKDDGELAVRGDTLAFTSSALENPLEIAGTPVAHLAHRSENPHADVFVRLSDVDPKGRSTNVSEGFVRLEPSTSSGDVRLELDAVAHRFAPGHRIRIIVAGGSFPRWERNLGTGEDPATSTKMAPSQRSIDLTRSHVLLPVVS